MRPIRTAQEALQASDATNALNYKKSFDMLLDYLLKEINNACSRGEYSIKVKLTALANYICSDQFNKILNEVCRVLSSGYEDDSQSEKSAGLGYTVEIKDLHLIIKWEDPKQSPLDLIIN